MIAAQHLKLLADYKVVPVIVIEDLEHAEPLAKTLLNNDLPIAEVTLRSPVALEAISKMKQACPDLLIIAGTVLTPEQADLAIEAGAELVVSPGFNPITMQHCIDRGIPIIPGVATPSEIEQALRYKIELVKFFPAEANGGVKSLNAISAPYSSMRFMPTGGISLENISNYLNLASVVCCGGSWMVDKELMRQKDWASIAKKIQLCRNL
ncbi:bifunctional 4-hydroxy-2-oxoglutarate aldolase/2-dehydro-3-deoxy-phosphogluconate aldolase [Vibrio fluminensis]|uniref:bifunctional 4-hydroxy-2-oxoglutarate aldolase/2-dehydro-3-deoxy-phosphogluconate aldolase n=1 Tax=Vibrio fluminensis TaxID=2783614 RepID=UPI001887E925|nr:bifunctional 4-hydroxy-2-oxoglutarate aldolase/2-dehydro-3-deoxy-phosphogluconate aldolase [Vibrio fluminensis]